MPGVRLDRFLTSTAVALVLAAAPIGARAESLSGPDTTATTGSDSTAGQQATSPDADKAAAKPAQATDPSTAAPTPAASAATPQPAASSAQPEITPPAVVAAPSASPQPAAAQTEPTTPAPATAAVPTPQPDQSAATPEAPSPAATAATPAAPENTGTAGPAETPAAAATPPAAPAVNEADAAIADQLRAGLASGKFDSLMGGKKDRILIDAFYSGRAYQPLWITSGKANEHAKSAIDYLGHVDADGLDPADYAVPNFATLSDPAALADAELRLSMSIITYAHHAAVGRVHWSRVSADIEYTDKPPEPADVLANMADAKDIPAALASYEPQTPGYIALKAKLAEIRAGKVDPSKPAIPNDRTAPRIGAQDDRVPALRDRLGVPGDGSTTYDKALADAVKKFQQEHELKATGLLTAATIEALNGRQPDRPTDIILANMERWRWMPHHFGNTYVIVNLPDYSLRLMHDGKLVWQTRIVVGKPAMPTPLMTGEMKFITINPTWNVPPSIVNHEYLPALAQDPTVLERMGLKVGHNPDGTIHIWQPPGDRNALGRIRFNFPNKFLVYQHDTPDKYMFAYDKRALSHGCMRVQDPQRYAELLLSLVRPGDDYSPDRIRRMIATGQETDIQFPTFVPVNLTYQTAFVDDQGKLEFRDDIYGRDKELLALLKSTGEERRVADIAVEHRVDISHRQVLAIPDQPSLWGGRSYASGGSNGRDYYPAQPNGGGFFARLFGGGFGSPPVAAPHKPVPRRRVTRAKDTVEQR
jgi:murein L,D-transpeptidase YcbB/YkuD